MQKVDRAVLLMFLAFATSIIEARPQIGEPPIVPPRPTKLVKPDCSKGKSCHGIHGLVIVTVDVLTDGRVGETTFKTGDDRLREVTLKAAKECRFAPGTFNGKPPAMNFDIQCQL
jgi:Gram-negative bacterial TonB protein C-terminal